ncbi:MAG: exodeoxyribonuclease VII large subunit, partial [Proteobacteria bacterium]|nr:exodeoxyribonuclease VII large subunit [Pseudomonadota bacterium]
METDASTRNDASDGDGAVGDNLPVFSVSEISGLIKTTMEHRFEQVRIRGELSGFKRAPSGHLYFSLKDENAVIDGVCWRASAARLRIRPEDGMEVIASGRITTYAGRSKYQVVVETLEHAGEGALLKLLEDRKRKLAAEGLFDEARKQLLPYLPDVIGVVTSPTGAVIRDILHRLADRFPRRVLVWPVLVQGDGAAAQVAAAIRGFNGLGGGTIPRPDLLIVARGGGSIEDLWAFNEEIVVRAAADSDIPLISAVGHETDWTLIDLAADVRAPTPTAAAELAEIMARQAELLSRLTRALGRRLQSSAQQLKSLDRALAHPKRRLEAVGQRLDDRAQQLVRAMRLGIDRRRQRMPARLPRPDRIVRAGQRTLDQMGERLGRAGQGLPISRRARLGHLAALIESYSY